MKILYATILSAAMFVARGGSFEEMVPMRDGTRLYTYGIRPAEGVKCPIVIQRNPYVEEGRVDLAVFEKSQAGNIADDAARTFDAYQRVLFDEAAGRYRDGVGTDHATVQGNAMALACGVVPPERAGSVADYVAAKGFSCSTYMAQFVLEALFAAGRDGDAFRLMLSEGDRGWLSMMAKGATITPEFWDLTMEEPGRVPDMNHAWSTAPLNMLSRRVLGVTPLKPGFEEVAVRPRPGPLKRLSGAVPTPKGLVRLSMELKGGVWRVSLSSPVPAKFEFAERHELDYAK